MDKKPVVPTMEEVESEDDNSEIDLDFEFDDEIKESLDILLSVPLVFEDHSHSSDEEGEAVDEARTKQTKGDSVERQLEELFVDENNDREGSGNKDTGLENISDIEFDGPESGECDTSDGELPDSPSIVARLPNNRPCNVQGAVDVSFDEESDVELLEKYTNKSRDYYDTLPQKGSVSKPERRVVMESRLGQENIKLKEKKGKDPSKIKVRSKSRDKKDKTKKKGESGIADEDMKRKLKLKKYFARLNQYKAKCLEYMNQISNKCDIKKDDKDKMKSYKMKHLKREEARMKSIVNRVNMAREISPHSSTSSKHDKTAHITVDDLSKRRSNSRDKERKSKSEKKFKSKSKELKEHKIKYQKYIQYLQSERTKCFEEKVAIEKHKHKSKKKHRKSKSSSPEKIKDKNTFRPAILSFSEFCNSRELVTPEKVLQNKRMENVVQVNHAEPTSPDNLLRMNVAVDSLATSSSAHNHIDHTDDDKELFITYSDLVEQDKIQENKKLEEEKKAKIDTILEKDPELQSISVFTSVLFKGSKDSEGIPFMEEEPPRPKTETPKPKPIFTQPSGPDEIYDWNDDLSTISQSSFSPSRSPAPKIHNKSILNYLENQKERSESGRKSVDETMSLEYSRSRSRSPKKPKLKSKKIKRKHYSSISVSPSPPPLKCRSPDHYKKKVSPPAYLKERWKDYPSPHGRKKEHHYERPSRSRRRSRSRTRPRAAPIHHRSRSSSEERHYRRHRTPSPAMVTDKRRKLRAEHEKALALLRASNSKSTTPLSLTFSSSGDNSEAVRDNYDPVVMNEDSSSPGVPDGPVEKSTPVLPPLPPGLPPEPPPVPPPPAVESTVITTYTSFVPLPNTNIMPPQHHPADMVIPMGYPDVHQIGPPPFNNWLGRNMQMSDMGANMQHHMYAQPPMLNNYDQFNAPPQQAFPFLNQPPPPLPYPMQMPPPCHQHYHMPNQGHSSNINLISIHQEIKNVNPKPVVITQFPDSLEKDFPQKTSLPIESGNKCKHNPLGQNNQTVQEAINSVKKCLKNCDGMKIKDPRLAPMETRSKSPDKFETSSPTSSSTGQSDDRKVKIKLNYKPRPVSGVEQTSSLEPEFDTETTTKKSEVPNETVKANKYLEKNCKIEGIVSKLKDTIGTTSCTIEKSEFPPRSLNNDLKQSKDEPCNPENTDECVTKETSNVSTDSKKQSCIQNISAKETECQNSCSLDGKPSKHSTMKKKIGVKHSLYAQNQVIPKPDKTTQNEDKVIASGKEEQVKAPDLSRNNSVDKIDGQSQQKKVESNGREINDKQKISKPKRAVDSEQDFVSKAHKDCLSNLDNSVDNNTSSNTNNETKTTLALKSGQKTLSNVKTPSDKDKDTTDCNKSKVVDSNRNRKINTANKILESLTTEANSDIEQNISETQKIKLKENPTINVKSTNVEKDSGNSSYVHNSENVSEIEATASLLSLNIQQKVNTYTPDIEKEEFSSEIKHSIINENRAPVLSIPTKGELKRFPTPERTNKTTPKSFLDKKRGDKCNSFDTKDSKTKKNLDSNAIKPKTKEIEESSTNVVESILHDFEDSNSTGSDGQGSGKYKNESSKIKTKSSPLSNILTEISAESKEKMNKTDTLNIALVTQSSVDSLRSHKIQNDADNTKLPSQPLYQAKGSDSLLTVSEKNVNSESASQEVKKKETIPVNSDNSKEDENPVSKEVSPGKELVIGKGDDCLTNTRRSKRKSKNDSLIISHFTSDSMEKENNDSIVIEEASLNMLNSSKEPHTNLEDLGKKSLNDSLHITSETDSAETLNDHSSVKPISSVLIKPCPLSKKSYSYIEHNLPTSFDLSTDGHLIEKGFKKLRVSVEKCTTSLTAIKETHNVSSTLPKQSNSPEGYAKCTNDLKYDSKVKFDINDTLVKPQANFSNGNELTEEHTTKKLGVHLDKPTPDSLNDESVDSMSEHIESCDETSSNINDDNLVNNTLLHCTGNGQEIENNTELEDYIIEEGQDTISKPKSKKRVTFDMNIIEIKPNCYASLSNTAEEKEILIKKSNNQIERVVCINESPQSICDVLPQSDISSESHGVSEILEKSPLKADENVPKENDDKNLNQNKTLNSEQIMENYSNNILLYYNNIMKTLDIFKSSPLPNVEKRKSVFLTIPKPEDMPEAKILDSPKKAHKNKKKVNALENLDVCMNLVPIEKATISSENITEEVISKPLPNNKNLTEFISSENIREEIISKPLPSDKNLTELNNEQSKKLKNNNSRSEQNESDNDDSVILDRELSDLAKGCLDSDSTVGGDDDSVLNFGITAPENNTLAIKFDLNKDKTITSKLPTCEQSKLFSPRNIKKRFLKKIKSAVKNTESKTYLDILESSAQETPVTIQPRKKKLSLRISEAQGHRSPNHRNLLISNNVNTASIDSDTNNPISDLDFIVDLKTKNAIKGVKSCKVYKKRRKRFRKKQHANLKKVSDIEFVNKLELKQRDACSPHFEIALDEKIVKVRDCDNTKKDSIVEKDINELHITVGTVKELDGNEFSREGDLEEQNTFQEEILKSVEDLKTNSISPLRKIRKTKNNVKCKLNDDHEENRSKIPDAPSDDFKDTSGLSKNLTVKANSIRNNDEEDLSHHITEPNLCAEEYIPEKTLKLSESRLRRTRKGKTVEQEIRGDCETMKEKPNKIISENDTENIIENKISPCDDKLGLTSQYTKVKSEMKGLEISLTISTQKTCSVKKADIGICHLVSLEATKEILEENVNKEKMSVESSKEEHTEKDTSSIFNTTHTRNKILNDNCVDKDNDINESFKVKKKGNKTMTKLKTETSLEAVSSPEPVRKTRAHPKKDISLHQDQTKCRDIVDESEYKVNTINQEDICETILKNKLKDITEFKLKTENVKCDLITKEDKLDIKERLLVSRSMSTDSIDEPLIFVKEKLLADKLEEEKSLQENKVCEDVEEKKNCNKLNDILKNINIQGNVKTCVSESSNSAGKSSEKEGNSCNEDNIHKNTDSDKNQSSSSFDTFYNAGGKSSNNVYDVSSSDTSAEKVLPHPPLLTTDNVNKDVSQTDPDICSSFSNSSINIKSKDALRKKRDKAEVDAEIKRRLAEIDELEKLARSQHASLVDKIGVRTRSKAGNKNKSIDDDDDDDDVVSISSDDSHNSLTSGSITPVDIKKSEDVINEEPTTTHEIETTKLIGEDCEETKLKIDSSNSISNDEYPSSLSTDKIKKTRNKKENKMSEHELKPPEFSGNTSTPSNDNVETDSYSTSEKISVRTNKASSDVLTELSASSDGFITSKSVISKKSKQDLDNILPEIVEKVKNVSSSLREEKPKRARRNVVSVYQFRGTDDEKEPKTVAQDNLNTDSFSQTKHVSTKDKNKTAVSTMKLNHQLFQEVTLRKTRNKASINKMLCDKNIDYSPELEEKQLPCESLKEPILYPEPMRNNSENSAIEPDSSTPGLSDNISTSPIDLQLLSAEIPETQTHRIDVLSAEHNIVEPSLSIQEKLPIVSSPRRLFREPCRKSLLHKKRKRRKSICGRSINVPNNMVAQDSNMNLTNESNDDGDRQSEEPVSSSDTSLQSICTKTKKRRRRKTVMDLLMEDSMLSVMRDFPMSPNPYMLPTFYKDIDISSQNNKMAPCNDSSVAGNNPRESIQNHEVLPKPDIISQKLRLLEKLKNISRKNRKTRQCRTLVCYNEDSLPESLVESPVGETTINNTDVSIIPQEIISLPNTCENESNSSLSEKIDLLKDQSEEALDNVLVTSPELKKGVRNIITKFQLKKRRNTRFTNTLKKKKKQNQLRRFFSEESNILQNDSAEMKNNHLKAQTIFQQIDTNSSMVSTNKIINQDEPSDFDKLLETKPNETVSKLNTFEQPLSKINFEDKSDDGSDIYHSACPSPLPSDSEDDGNIHMKKLSYVPVISPSVHCLKPSTEIQPNKILCSILKARVGKMLPYFGETTTDDEGLDEDTPLLVRFSRSNEIVNLSPIHEKSKISNSEEEIASDSHAVNSLTITKNSCVSEEPALQNNLRISEIKVTRKCNVDSPNEENCEITSKEVEKDGGLLPLNASSPVLLRKSTRKSKTINLLPQTNNYLQSNVDNLLTETKTLLTNDVKCGDESNLALSDQPVLPRKRGRPRKIKITEVLDSIDESKVELVEKRLDEKKDPLYPSEDNETPLTEVTENVSFNKRRGRKPKNNTDSIENLSSRETIYGEIKNDDDNLDVLSDTLKVNHGSPRLELSDLDSAIQKSITLRQTRSRHTRLNKTPQKNYKNQINDSIQHEENMDIEEKLEFSSNDISNNLSTDKQVGTKRRGRKRKPVILNNNIQSLAEDKSSGILEGSNDSCVQIPSVTKKYELDTEEPYNEFPPALVKTRARRPRIAIPDNVYLEPPNLEIPYTSFSDVKSSENFDFDSALVKDSNEILSSKGRGGNVRQMLELNTHSNGETDFLFTVVPKEVENALNENENSEKGDNKMCYPKQPHLNTEEKKTLPRKRGKKNKHKTNCKKTCKESNFSENKTNPEADSDIEINIPMLQNDFTNSDNFEDGSCSDTDNLIKPVLIVSEQNTEVVQRDLKRNTDCAESIEKKMSLAKESKKRTRNFTENVLMTESINNPTQMLEDSEGREVNESAIKKLKTQDTEPIKNPESDEIDKSCTSSCHEPSTDVCVNQAFLWSKISGFLNKTTRSVGTQVKVKNMALKGFDTSEPEVSLQSELTLPQVIKTLFEELKSIDSSFLNP